MDSSSTTYTLIPQGPRHGRETKARVAWRYQANIML